MCNYLALPVSDNLHDTLVCSALELSEDEEFEEDRHVLGGLTKSKNVARLLQLFDPGNSVVDRPNRPRKKKRFNQDGDLFKKELVVTKESLQKRERVARKEAEEKAEALLKKEQLNKLRQHSNENIQNNNDLVQHSNGPVQNNNEPVQNNNNESVQYNNLRRESFPKLTSVNKKQILPGNDSLATNKSRVEESDAVSIKRRLSESKTYLSEDYPEEREFPVRQTLPVIVVSPAPDLPSSESDPESDHDSDDADEYDSMQNELNDLRDLLASLKEGQSRSRNMLNSFRSHDYNDSLSGVYERSRKLCRAKEDALWQMNGSTVVQASNLDNSEKSFLDELNEAEDYSCWEEITFGESTEL